MVVQRLDWNSSHLFGFCIGLMEQVEPKELLDDAHMFVWFPLFRWLAFKAQNELRKTL